MPELNLAQAVAAPTAPKVQPAVWLGCLHCYNVGRLVGQWFPCDGIVDVTLGDVHGGTEHVLPGCEEVWCMDSEYLPAGTGEMSQACAAQWGELFAEVGEEQWSALLAWVASGCHIVDADDMPIASQFEERYCGLWSLRRLTASSSPTTSGCGARSRSTSRPTLTSTNGGVTSASATPSPTPQTAVPTSSETTDRHRHS